MVSYYRGQQSKDVWHVWSPYIREHIQLLVKLYKVLIYVFQEVLKLRLIVQCHGSVYPWSDMF